MADMDFLYAIWHAIAGGEKPAYVAPALQTIEQPLGATSAEAAPTTSATSDSDLPTAIFTQGTLPIYLEWAIADYQKQDGLSGRKELPEGNGMIFDFDGEPAGSGIWMKDMLFPIDVIWLSDSYKVVQIIPNMSPKSYPKVYGVPKGARYALEVSAGLAKKYSILVGDQFSF